MAKTFSVSYLYKALDKFTPTAKNINKTLAKQKRLTKELTVALDKSKLVFAATSAAMAAGFIGSAVAASKFEDGLTNVLTLLNQDTIKQYKGDLDKALESSVGLGFATQDASKALFDTVSAIGDVDKSIKVYNTSQKLAIGGVTSLSIAVDGITSVVNAYGKETTKATDVANTFFSAQRAGKTTVEALALNVGKVAPLAKQAGIGFDVLLASMSQLTLGGLSTEEASTALRGAIAGLLKPAEQAAKIMEAYNIPIGASALQSANFTDVLEKLAIAAKENPDALAEMIPNIRALTAIGALGSKEVKNLRKMIVDINIDIKNGTGLNEAYVMQMKVMSRQWKIMKGDIIILAKRFGEIFLPILISVFSVMSKYVKLLIEMPRSTKIIILVIGGLVFAMTSLLTVLAGIMFVLPNLIAAFVVLKTAFLLTWAAALGPIGLIIIGVTALAVAGVVLYQKWLPFQRLVDNIWASMEKVANVLSFGAVGGGGDSSTGDLFGKTGTFDVTGGEKSIMDINVNLNAPKDTVKSVETKKSMLSREANFGLNMQEV